MTISGRLGIHDPDYETALTNVAEALREIIRVHHAHVPDAQNQMAEIAKTALKKVLEL